VKCDKCQHFFVVLSEFDGRKNLREPTRPDLDSQSQRGYTYSTAQAPAKRSTPPPKKIFEYLDRHVVGQEHAKKVLAVAVYNHYKRLSINVQTAPTKSASEPAMRNLDGYTQLSNTLYFRNNAICLQQYDWRIL